MSQHPKGQLAPLPIGARAPEFALLHAPHRHLLSCRLQGRPMVLAFYPTDWEPVSREQLVLYQRYLDDFARLGACVIGISGDHVYGHAAFARDAQLDFPLLADFQPRGQVASQYGVYREAQGVCARALFVVDRHGIIQFSRTYPDELNPGVNDLLTTLEALAADRTAEEPEHQGANEE